MNKKILLFTILIPLLGSISCQLSAGGPKPARTVPASTEAASQILDNLDSSINNSNSSNEITITLTEVQLTSLLVEQLSMQSDFSIQNPQVLIQNNQVEIYGLVQKGSFSANARLVIDVSVDQMGQLQIALTSADLGPIPIPRFLFGKHQIIN